MYDKVWEVGYARDRAQGRRRYVASDDTRARLQELVRMHIPLRALADVTGLSDTTLTSILEGRHGQIQGRTAHLVTSATITDVYQLAGGHVPSIGAVRRVEALFAIGWRKSDLLALGMPPAQLVTRPRHLISADGWRQVREIYNRLSMTPGTSSTTRNRAARRGYAPPLAWDEETIDDPRAEPEVGDRVERAVDPIAVARAVSAVRPVGGAGSRDTRIPLTHDEGVAVARTLTARGASDREIASVLGVSSRTVGRLRLRYEIPSGATGSRPPAVPTDVRQVVHQERGFDVLVQGPLLPRVPAGTRGRGLDPICPEGTT